MGIKFNLSDKDIQKLVFEVLDKEKYWIKLIDRQSPDQIAGTKVIVRSFLGEENITLDFSGGGLCVSGCDNTYVSRFIDSYKSYVNSLVDKFKVESLGQGKMISLKYSLRLEKVQPMLCGKTQYRLVRPTLVRKLGNHVTFMSIPNPYYAPDRKIEVGGVYYANLDPIVGYEYGGKRPVLIVAKKEDLYICVPFSKSNYGDRIEVEELNGKEAYAVNLCKIIAKERIFNFVGRLSPEKYEEIAKQAKSFLEIEEKIKPIVDEEKVEEFEETLIYPTEEEYLAMIMDRLDGLNQRNQNRLLFARNGKLDYIFETDDKGNAVFKINSKHQDPKNGFVEMRYFFNGNGVRYESQRYGFRRFNDPVLRKTYLKWMLDKNENFVYVVFRNLVNSYRQSFTKKIEGESNQVTINNELMMHAANLKNLLDELGICYEEDYQALIKNETELNYSLISRVALPENDGDDEDDYENE